MNAKNIINDDMTTDLLSEVFYYVDGNLFWKKSRSGVSDITKPAGCLDSASGYTKITVNGRQYGAHVLIWMLFNGPIPDGLQIDHINRKENDNRIENLRLVTVSENARNRNISKNNSSGYNGVHYCPTRQGKPRWRAQITVEGEIIRLGTYKNKEDAIAARKRADTLYGYENGLDKSTK